MVDRLGSPWLPFAEGYREQVEGREYQICEGEESLLTQCARSLILISAESANNIQTGILTSVCEGSARQRRGVVERIKDPDVRALRTQGIVGQGCLHPHVHCVVPEGGIAPKATHCVGPRLDFFLPVKAMAKAFRGQFLDALREVFAAGPSRTQGCETEHGDSREI